MRTTANIDDDALAAARSLARDRSISLGRAISELIRRGLRRDTDGEEDGFPVFQVRPGARPLTLEDVQRSEEEA
ncbi:MAG: antitoxin [Armatimonadetes bacterium]|nr:antitoxin [Armatimonadota bacterium]